MRSTKRPRRPVHRYKSLLFPGIALLAVFAFWAAFAPAEKGETVRFEQDGLRLEITGVHHEGDFIYRFDPEQKTFIPIDTHHVYPGSKVTILEAPVMEDGTARWEFRVLGSGTPDRELPELAEGMAPVELSEKGEVSIYDLERERDVLYLIVREAEDDYWK